MSGRGRGRGRGGRDVRHSIPGFNYEVNGEMIDSKPTDLFPVSSKLLTHTKASRYLLEDLSDSLKSYKVPVPAIPTEKEKREVSFYLGLREQIHRGPVYTQPQAPDPTQPPKTYGQDQFNDQYHNKLKPDINPFEAMPRYSQKFEEKKRTVPQLSDRPFGKSRYLIQF
jgi:DNA-directed RNA polymerase III subunit RPC7